MSDERLSEAAVASNRLTPPGSGTTAQPAGTCPKCGGQMYALLTHHCTTSVRSQHPGGLRLTPWGTWEWRPW